MSFAGRLHADAHVTLRVGTTTDNGRSPCPISNFRLLGELERIIDFDAKVLDRTFQFRMA